jgi:glutamate-ammonia-ligase adenylyltransferase
MNISTLHNYLDHEEAAAEWLAGLGIIDVQKAHANLVAIATSGMTLDLVAEICDQAAPVLPACADPDRVLNNLARFVDASRSPLSFGALCQRDPETIPTLLQIFAVSQYFSDLLVNDPEALDLLRLTEGQPVAREMVVQEIVAEASALDHDHAVLSALRRFKQRETLRIAYGDIIREQSLNTVTRQISYLADAILEAALQAAWQRLRQQRGTPLTNGGKPARFVVLAMGKLGGEELNYSSDIDLIFLYDGEGKTDGPRSITNAEFFDRLAREVVRLLTEKTELGSPYRVDMRLRPDGERGPLVPSVASAMNYYDIRGRTWERQAYIKARPAAGDLDLGREFLVQLQPWIYGRYLSRADISGIRALKRRIEQRTHREGGQLRNVKTGHGGIRDIEFVIQFLQLLNGGDLKELRTTNTLDAIVQLEHVGCLSNLERTILEENYCFLRKVEHRLQIMFDLQTHMLPDTDDEMRKVAMRMGYTDQPEQSAMEAFAGEYRSHTELNRKILDHLLNDAFPDDDATEAVVDLVLDPSPEDQEIVDALGKYGFRDVKAAFRNLMSLGEEKIRFLSTRRCRHFLAAIAPQLLAAIAATPDPDSTLVNLDKVSESLGGKGVLWELFSFNPPSLRLYVDLCAYSPFLSGILTSSPGMIDSLMDSLVLDKLPGLQRLSETLAELCYGAEDLDPILYSFKNDQQLSVGVRDILGKEDVQSTTAALSNIAEVCLGQIAAAEYEKLVGKFGCPTIAEGPRAGLPCEMVILGMGKFGGQEMNYHSDLDIVFLYEADGHTAPVPGRRSDVTSNQHFFGELGTRVIKTASRLSVYGRLYEVDARLRPTGKSGSLATSLAEFERYFQGDAQLWERQALCKARVVYGSERATAEVTDVVARAAVDHPWRPADAREVRQMRRRLEQAGGAGNLKRGEGGLVDVEFLVQMLQLKHGRNNPAVRLPNTLAALAALRDAHLLDPEDFQAFDTGYRFLRTIESRLRLMKSAARDTLPDDSTELAKLARLLHYPSAESLLADYLTHTQAIRRRFDSIFDNEESES